MPDPFVPPLSFKQVLIYNYIYDDDLDATGTRIDCTKGCTIPIDPSMTFYYRIDYLDTSGAVIESSPVYTYESGSTIEYPYSGSLSDRVILHKAVIMSGGV